ncbi:Crp/Fnr family transcriptional regulator [uncultured Anaerococcus sp.]|uniref:Crp/Fnr family transcriptional regulator n=1 Tax=uncultured Anaerococcus sp. TaxID=293428 RepID=UPI00288A38B3|nr:Crp/Fnr family transcriptional regulator [uncultured Anaerococcus sp.]
MYNYKKDEESFLAFLTDEELARFRYRPQVLLYKKGDVIFSFGDKPDFMYIILEGFIKISTYLSDGREQILYIYGEDDFVGAHNLLTDENYIYEAKSLSKSKLLIISKLDFNNVLKKNNQVLIKILNQSFRRIRRSEDLIDRLSTQNADMKVAKLLLDLAADVGIVKKDGVLITFHLSREELGSYSGVVRETLSRKLSSFEKMGLIKIIGREEILITNIKALEKMTS